MKTGALWGTVLSENQKVKVGNLPHRRALYDNPFNIIPREWGAYCAILPLLTQLVWDLSDGPSEPEDDESGSRLGICCFIVGCILKARFPRYIGAMHAALSQALHAQHCSWRARDLLCKIRIVSSARTELRDAVRLWRPDVQIRVMMQACSGPLHWRLPFWCDDNVQWMVGGHNREARPG